MNEEEPTMNRCCNQSRTPRQRGATLLEVLVSIVVLALGLLGIIGVQLRTLADTQTAVRRAQAIRLIEDLSERIYANPSSLNPAVLANYVGDWTTAGSTVTVPPCAGCGAGDFALNQFTTWQNSVSQNLPSGTVKTFLLQPEPAGNRRQLGVLASWRQNERVSSTDRDYYAYMNPFTTTTQSKDDGGADVDCPPGGTCHLQFISLTSRCVPDPLSGPGVSYCASGVAP
jgi:type IV pilus assembly protein PilV